MSLNQITEFVKILFASGSVRYAGRELFIGGTETVKALTPKIARMLRAS